jgi:hypothetical protein
MGWVTDINFLGDLDFNGVQIKAGTHTQVRWDIGIGNINIDATGKIVSVDHYAPIEYKPAAKEAYEKDLLTFTGILDANMSWLHFHKGQLLNCDLFYGRYLECYVLNQLHAVKLKTAESFKHVDYPEDWKNLECSVSEKEGNQLCIALDLIRKQLEDGIVFQHPDIDPDTAAEALKEFQRKNKVLKD